MGLGKFQTNSGSFEEGNIPWNKGLKGYNKGHTAYNGNISGENNPFFRKEHSLDTKLKMRLAKLGKRNEECNAWQGGKTKERTKIMSREEYKYWRNKVFERDDYTCQKCGQHGRDLEAHHNKFFSKFPELRFEVDNGITMCKDCHRHFHRALRRC